jgi:hypothetical protein
MIAVFVLSLLHLHDILFTAQRKHAGAYKGFKGLRPIEGAPTEKGEVQCQFH